MPIRFYDKAELDFDNFTEVEHYQAFLYGEAMDIGGGTITKEEIDLIKQHPELERIAIVGLHQDTFDYFVENYADQFKAIYFFKNKLVEDLSLLGKLEHVEAIGYFVNQRVEKLWNMTGNKCLTYLNIDDFSRLHTLEGIEKAPALKYLSFGNKIWDTSKFSYVPDLSTSHLEKVSYSATLPYEETYKFLQCPKLKQLDFRVNLYAIEFLAWICANYPHIEGYCLKPYILFESSGDGFICGKRKPHFYDFDTDKTKTKLKKAVERFNAMKTTYKDMPFDEMIKRL